MKKMVEVNINNYCEVVVREPGVRAIREHFADFKMEVPRHYDIVAGDTLREQIWVLMNIFGPEFGNGVNSVIETTIKVEV